MVLQLYYWPHPLHEAALGSSFWSMNSGTCNLCTFKVWNCRFHLTKRPGWLGMFPVSLVTDFMEPKPKSGDEVQNFTFRGSPQLYANFLHKLLCVCVIVKVVLCLFLCLLPGCCSITPESQLASLNLTPLSSGPACSYMLIVVLNGCRGFHCLITKRTWNRTCSPPPQPLVPSPCIQSWWKLFPRNDLQVQKEKEGRE